jgi:hypothetical protein
MKAPVAAERAMVVATLSMLTNGELPRSRRGQFHRCRPGSIKANAIRQLQALGYAVTVEPATA